jgi:PIN domain nuclease of toxin-antitoxin system
LRILVDTHAFLWAISADQRYQGAMRQAMENGENELYLSVASIWEILIKSGMGKLTLPKPTAEFIAAEMFKNRVRRMGIQASHLAALEKLPPLHKDPFDRMLVAQAKAEGIALVSTDEAFAAYGINIIGH